MGKKPGRKAIPFSVKIQGKLDAMGYQVFPTLVRASHFGVPQWRPRYIMIAVLKTALRDDKNFDPYVWLEEVRTAFLQGKKLTTKRDVSVKEAISDLELVGKELVPCEDTKGYVRIKYDRPRTHYQRLLHGDLNGVADG